MIKPTPSNTYGIIAGLIAALAGLMASPGEVRAEATKWVNTDISQIRLIAAREGGKLLAGLHIRIEPGWKTYWRSPGDSGLPTVVDWTGSENISTPRLTWPLPKRVEISGFQTFVYEDEVVLPLELSPLDESKPITIRAAVDFAVCKDICVPLQADLTLSGPGAAAETSDAERAQVRLIRRYSARVPVRDSAVAGLKIDRIGLLSGNQGEVLEVALYSVRALTSPGLIVEVPPPFAVGAARIFGKTGDRQVTLRLPVSAGRSKRTLAGVKLILTAHDGDRAFEKDVIAPALQKSK